MNVEVLAGLRAGDGGDGDRKLDSRQANDDSSAASDNDSRPGGDNTPHDNTTT
ncbi:hypothetical protein VC83_02065 [Pseudogymnoascus destructans]|uniref:Uncharacterized protein n=1 Tax=Pseudogymnoascus destructans TaxID=655981 RepID=A0A177AJP3_9PEZI|nr:uncharacterized protein VC83_02065 [Pseudogymnoascus destructans]OAF61384.1 hypothetical protein VC83_02065 [Pseudogymnoascus destructans]